MPTVVVAPVASPKLVLATAAVLAPVPPSAIGNVVLGDNVPLVLTITPVVVLFRLRVLTFAILPPVIATAPASCVAIDPSPRFDLEPGAVDDPVPPDAKGIGALSPVIVPPVMLTALEYC